MTSSARTSSGPGRPEPVAPMLATAGPLPEGNEDEWAYEFKWDGFRAVVVVADGVPSATSRNGHDLTPAFPELTSMAEALGPVSAVLDGELVVLDGDGVPSFAGIQRRNQAAAPTAAARDRDPVSFVAFDLLHLDGRDLLGDPYDDRRRLLDEVLPGGPSWGVTPSFRGQVGTEVLATATRMGMEGVVAKRRRSVYRPGRRSPDWVKTKLERTQEVVVGGWTTGNGARRGTFGALVVGIPTGGGAGLRFAGKVGTGFDDAGREALLAAMRPLERSTPPFGPEVPAAVARTATWIRPTLVGEVRFREWTGDDLLRHPVWRGLRPDKRADEVVREP